MYLRRESGVYVPSPRAVPPTNIYGIAGAPAHWHCATSSTIHRHFSPPLVRLPHRFVPPKTLWPQSPRGPRPQTFENNTSPFRVPAQPDRRSPESHPTRLRTPFRFPLVLESPSLRTSYTYMELGITNAFAMIAHCVQRDKSLPAIGYSRTPPKDVLSQLC